MPSDHLILCHFLLLLPSISPSIRLFSNESALHIRWPKYWSFSFSNSPSNEYSGLVSFRMDWLDLLAVQGIIQRHPFFALSLLYDPTFSMVQLYGPTWDLRETRREGMGCLFLVPFTKISRPEPGCCLQDDIMLVCPRSLALFLSVLAQGIEARWWLPALHLGKKEFFLLHQEKKSSEPDCLWPELSHMVTLEESLCPLSATS